MRVDEHIGKAAESQPQGLFATGFTFDADSELTAISFQLGNTVLGTLAYTYDLAGRRTVVGGSYVPLIVS